MQNSEVADKCLNDLYYYAQVMFPERYFGEVHKELFNYFQLACDDALLTGREVNKGALIPRDHQKSFCLAVTISWLVTKHPWITVAYVSSNPQLAQDQLTLLKNIFLSENHRELFPELLNFELSSRTKQYEHKPKGTWTLDGIDVDHPLRPKGE